MPSNQPQRLFSVGRQYTRADIYRILNVPDEQQRGNWDTGYNKYLDEWYLFPTVGGAGRTGNDYGNRWLGDDLEWFGKTGSKLAHPSIRSMLSGEHPVHIFTRDNDRSPFTYQGIARPKQTNDTTPVTVIWEFSSLRPTIEPGEVNQSKRYVEGAIKTIFVNAHERNPAARHRCIEHHGVTCQVCGMSFAGTYGEIGKDFIHVHHLRTLADVGKEYEVDPINDLRPVCPNCHAMLHRTDPPTTIEALRTVIDAVRQ